MAEQTPQFQDANSYAAGSDRAFWLDFLQDGSGNRGSATDGGFVNSSDLAVTQNGTPNMSVNVAAGVCYVMGDVSATQGPYRCYNDSTVNKVIAAAHATLSRKDLVVAHLYDNALDSSGFNKWALEVVTGTPASSPIDPSIPSSSLKIARVNVAPAATSIVNANIDDLRTRASMVDGPQTVRFLDPADNFRRIQFGVSTVNLTNGQTDTSTTINFAFAFGSTPVILMTQLDNATNSYHFHVVSRSTTNFVCGVRKPDNSAFAASITTQICWFAVG